MLQVLRPSCHLQHLQLWSALYTSESAPTAALEVLLDELDHTPDTDAASDVAHLPKTRSCEDLLLATETEHIGAAGPGLGRRLSDPSLVKTDSSQLLRSLDDEFPNGNVEEEETEETVTAATESDASPASKGMDTLITNMSRTALGSTEPESSSESVVLCDGHASNSSPSRENVAAATESSEDCDASGEVVTESSDCDNVTSVNEDEAVPASPAQDQATEELQCNSVADKDLDNARHVKDSSKYLFNGCALFNGLHADGSTDTLVEDVERTTGCEYAKTETGIPEIACDHTPCEYSCDERQTGSSLRLPEKLSHISTSTSDISDSHVHVRSRQAQDGVWWDGSLLSLSIGVQASTCNGKVGAAGASSGSEAQSASYSGKTSSTSLESDGGVSQYSCSTPCSTNPPTPGVDAKVRKACSHPCYLSRWWILLECPGCDRCNGTLLCLVGNEVCFLLMLYVY